MKRLTPFDRFKQVRLSHHHLILRDRLAIDRTHLANQRTLLAFFRTGLYLLMTAAAVWNLEFLRELRWIGGLATVVGVLVMLIGVLAFIEMRRKIYRSYQPAISDEVEEAISERTSEKAS